MAPATGAMLYELDGGPEQGIMLPVMGPGAAGVVVTATGNVLAAVLPQLLVAVTEILPELLPVLTVIDVVPWPELIAHPFGTDQV